MTFRLTIDRAAWLEHLHRTVACEPGLVPVVKGNGYGVGLDLAAAVAAELATSTAAHRALRGVDTVAVGTGEEALRVARAFSGDLLVLEGDRAATAAGLAATFPEHLRHRVVRTVATSHLLEDVVEACARGRDVEPFVVEVDAGMNRQGVTAPQALSALHRLRAAGQVGPGRSVSCRGIAVHLPVGGGLAGVRRLSREVAGTAPGTTLWVSHLGRDAVQSLVRTAPSVRIRERVGTRLWLGAAGALRVTGTVLDVRPVRRGTRIGYSRRRILAPHVVVVSGGAGHGVGMSAPSPRARQRLVAPVQAIAGALGLWFSPYGLDGRRLTFADTPHLQVSLLALPRGARLPLVGEQLTCRVRMTTSRFDEVCFDDEAAAAPDLGQQRVVA